MKSRLTVFVSPLNLLLLLFLIDPVFGAASRHVEDFLDRSTMDPANSTACWDTVAGEIRLPAFSCSPAGSCLAIADARRVAVDGDFAYVTDNDFGLRVVDIRDPENPELSGSCTTPDQTFAVAVAGDYAYVACRYSGLQVIDISDPYNPFIAGSCVTPDWAFGIAVAGDHAYVADGWGGGLQVIDVSDPTAPVIVGSLDTPTCAWYVAVEGDHAFIAEEQSGLMVVDVSDPSDPVFAGSLETTDFIYHVAVAGDVAYLAADYGGVLAVDITDRTNPVLLGTCDTPDRVRSVTIAGDHLYATDGDTGLLRIETGDPSHMFIADTCETPVWANDVAVAGEYAFVADVQGGLQVIKVAEAVLPPRLAGSAASPGNNTRTVDVVGDYAFVADYNAGLLVYDISMPTAPVLAGSSGVPGYALDVAVAGDFAFVANNSHRLDVFDVSDPAHPGLAGYCNCGSYPAAVTISGDQAFVGDAGGAFYVVDISEPRFPMVVDGLGFGGIQDVWVEGSLAYLVDSNGALRVVDVHDPANIIYLGGVGVPGNPMGLAVAGDHVFVGTHGSGLQVVDVSDPVHPVLVGSCSTPGVYCRKVSIAGNHAFIGGHENGGLLVVDISTPASPVLLGSYNTPGAALGVAIAGDHAFVADYTGGLQVLEVFNRRFEIRDFQAQSVVLGRIDAPIQQVRLVTTQYGSVSWNLGFEEGTGWHSFSPGAGWQAVPTPGPDLKWRSILNYQATMPMINPTCSALTLDWTYEFPVIDSIADIPGDQGGCARISWTRSSHDMLGADPFITEYAVFRRIDASLVIDGVENPDRVHLTAYPGGDWDFVTTVPADVEDRYSTVVPTLADSSIVVGLVESVFFVRARTAVPGVYYDAPPDSGYSVDNLAPNVPEEFLVAYGTGGPHLSWEESPDVDFRYFRIYRGSTEDFEPAPDNLIHQTVAVQWRDLNGSWADHYKVSAVDFAGNESGAAAPDQVTGAPGAETPAGFALLQNTPNPFNPLTSIPFEVPDGGGRIRLEIFDLVGRLVVTLVDAALPSGPHAVEWTGRDAAGRRLGSGVYLYRLTAPGFMETREMLLVR